MSLPRDVLAEPSVEWFVVSFRDARYSILAANALVIYEWCNCLEDEITLVLHSSWTSVKIAYLVCRYYPLFFWPLLSWAYVGNHSLEVCSKLGRPVHALAWPLALSAQAVLFMRAYAFSGRNLIVLVILSACFAFVVGSHIWFFWADVPILTEFANSQVAAAQGGIGCFVDYRASSVGLRVGLAMLAVLIFDFVTLIIVIFYCLFRESQQTSLGKYFLRQGLSAFAFTSAVEIVGLIIYFRVGGSYGGVSLPFIFVVPALVACRLILQLRRRVIPSEHELSRQHSRLVRYALATRSADGTTVAADVWAIHGDRVRLVHEIEQ